MILVYLFNIIHAFVLTYTIMGIYVQVLYLLLLGTHIYISVYITYMHIHQFLKTDYFLISD